MIGLFNNSRNSQQSGGRTLSRVPFPPALGDFSHFPSSQSSREAVPLFIIPSPVVETEHLQLSHWPKVPHS